MRAACLLSVLVVALPLAAQTKGPTEVTVAPGRLAAVPLTVDADAADYVILGEIDAFREYDPDPKQIKLRVIGYTPGTAYVVLSSVKAGKLQPMFTVKVTVGGPAPPVPPGPGPKPPDPKPPDPPPPADLPIKGEGLRMLVVWETAELSSYPSGQVAAMTSADVRDYLRRKCPKGSDGVTPEFRVFDKDRKPEADSLTWRLAFDRAVKAGKFPRLLIANGKDGYEGDLPATAAELLTLLKKYGGE